MIKNRIANLTLIGILAGALVACGSDDDDDSSVTESPDTTSETSMPADGGSTPTESPDTASETSMPAGGGSAPDSTVSSAPAGVNGIWLLSCREEDPGAIDTLYEITQLDIMDDIFVVTVSVFSDSNCTIQQPFSPATSTFSVVYSGTTETSLGTATNIDLTQESVEFPGLEDLGSQADFIDDEVALDILLVMNDTLFLGDGAPDDDFDGFATDDSAEPDPEDSRPDRLDFSEQFIRQP